MALARTMVLGWAATLGLSGLCHAESSATVPASDMLRFEQMCDASAVVLGRDGNLLVAEDAGNRLMLFAKAGGAPLARFDLGRHVKAVKAHGGSHVSLEGAARVGDLIYFVTSHARTRRGNLRPTFHRFFALQTRSSGTDEQVRPFARSYMMLARDMENDAKLGLGEALQLAELQRPELAPGRAGFDIQGLAAARDGRGLLVALQNPLRDGKALIVPFENPDRVISGVETASFGKLIALDLGGRGIASLEWVPGQHAYFVLAAARRGAQPDDPSASATKLYRWSGDAEAAPVFVQDVGAGDLRPQAMAASHDGRRLVVLSDDGERLYEGLQATECNGPLMDGDKCPCARVTMREKRYFRGRWIDITQPEAVELATPSTPAPATKNGEPD